MASVDKAPQVPTPLTAAQKKAIEFQNAFLADRREQNRVRYAEFIAQGYIECVVVGCNGLVAPKYQKDFQGTKAGFCPRTEDHKRLQPDMFAAKV
jgi:hypothetical protein